MTILDLKRRLYFSEVHVYSITTFGISRNTLNATETKFCSPYLETIQRASPRVSYGSSSPHQGLLIGHMVFLGLFCEVTSVKHIACASDRLNVGTDMRRIQEHKRIECTPLCAVKSSFSTFANSVRTTPLRSGSLLLLPL